MKKAAEMQKVVWEKGEHRDRQTDLSSKKSQLDHARKSVLLKSEMPVNQKVKL